MIPQATTVPRPAAQRLWLSALVPLLLLAALVTLIVLTAPGESLRAPNAPPVERLNITRAQLGNDGIVLDVINDGPDAVTIAQVIVDDAYWAFSADRTVLGHLGRTKVRIPYPWVEAEAHLVKLVTSTGTTFEHEIPVALATPRASARYLLTFTLIGLYVGVIPVALGLLWFPLAARLGRTGIDVLLAVTVGLLLFLLVDTVTEGFESSAALPSSFQGLTLFLATAAGAWLLLDLVGHWLRATREKVRAGSGSSGAVLSLLIAIGIGLHNFGEGLAIGAAFALGEAALGTLLIIGFTLHNTTEGLAIIAPIAREPMRIGQLARLGLIGGVPTIFGAWMGGLVQSPIVAVVCLGLGAGAIAQVIVQISKQMAGAESISQRFATAPIMAGLLAGFVVMYATGMMVG